MAFHDCDVEEADILEVQSVSDMFSAFKTPAADAVKLIGGDDIAVFSPQLGLMVVTSQYDLEEPATTSQTVILSLADAECTWPDPPEYISDIVFECRWPSGANLVTEFQTVLEIEPGEICAPYIVAKQATVAAKHGARTDEGGGRSARMKGGSL